MVSIIIPTFNDIEKLKRALMSISKIDFSINNFEVIIVDDGSTDGTSSFLEQFKTTINFTLRYFYQMNSGPATARKFAAYKPFNFSRLVEILFFIG